MRVDGRRRRAGPALVVACALAAVGWPVPAGATWSLVATDAATGEAGVALASCVPVEILGSGDRPLAPVVLVPGSAAAVTQGQLNLAAPERIRELLAVGATPAEVVSSLVDPTFDPSADTRQHAVVALDGAAAAVSGPELGDVAADRQGDGVSVQGNLLVSELVVRDALRGYIASRDAGAGLATALAQGLLAGSQAGGDRRCPGQTALFAHVAVAGPDPGAEVRALTVAVEQGDGQNPVELLVAAQGRGADGLLDGRQTGSGGRTVLVGAAVTGLVLAVCGGLLFRRGLGSVRARR